MVTRLKSYDCKTKRTRNQKKSALLNKKYLKDPQAVFFDQVYNLLVWLNLKFLYPLIPLQTKYWLLKITSWK